MSHILFISHSRSTHGAETVMIQAVKACVARKARVTVVVPSIVPDEGLEKALNSIHGVQILPLPYRAAGGNMLRTHLVRLYNLGALISLVRFIEQEQVSAIYSNTCVSILGAELAHRTNTRHIWHWHESVDERFGWHFTLTKYYQRLVSYTDTLVFISQHQLDEWEKTLQLNLSKARVIYNPVKPITPKPEGNLISKQGICIGFIGHFEERKNLPLLLQTFVSLHAKEPKTRLRLCGATGKRDYTYIQHITDLHEPELTVLPQTTDVTQFYQDIDILVLPSWRETMPLVVLEAMQAGVCVLQTNRSYMTELLEGGKETLFFSPDKPEDLEQLLMLCMDEEYRRSIAKAGQKKALQIVQNQSFDDQIATLLCE